MLLIFVEFFLVSFGVLALLLLALGFRLLDLGSLFLRGGGDFGVQFLVVFLLVVNLARVAPIVLFRWRCVDV